MQAAAAIWKAGNQGWVVFSRSTAAAEAAAAGAASLGMGSSDQVGCFRAALKMRLMVETTCGGLGSWRSSVVPPQVSDQTLPSTPQGRDFHFERLAARQVRPGI